MQESFQYCKRIKRMKELVFSYEIAYTEIFNQTMFKVCNTFLLRELLGGKDSLPVSSLTRNESGVCLRKFFPVIFHLKM